MKFSYNWLKELSGTKNSPEKLAEILALHAFEVEGIEKIGESLDRVVVAKILEIKKHPNANNLSLVRLTIGNSQFVDVVCGASNIKVGDKIPLALIGAKLASGLEIKKAEIRGVESFGMLCAQDELGLGEDHSGILILDKELKIGKLLADELHLKDTILDIKITADRGHDVMSHVGLAREICAIEGRRFSCLKAKLPNKKSKMLRVEIKDKDLCSRYIGIVMHNVKISSSPPWMQARLRAIGIRPINNVVDATNYVMLELGQPMHAFDFSKLKAQGSKVNIIVRRAKNGEKIKLLDKTEKTLTSNDLVIADEKKILAVAGIMGGEDSAVNTDTKNVILESANFNPVAIRRTRINLGIKTESADRFEKGLDPNLAELASVRVMQIINSFSGKLEGVADFYPSKLRSWKVKLELDYVNRLLGEKIPVEKIIEILNSLDINTRLEGKKRSNFHVLAEIPTLRLDLQTQEDLIEEIGRIYGYEKILPQAPYVPVKMCDINEGRKFVRLVKNILTGKGFSEIYGYSFYSRREAGLAELGGLQHLELENPMNPNQSLMRVSLIPGVLKNVRENLKKYKDITVFEIGRVYWPNNDKLPDEKTMLVGAVARRKQATKNERRSDDFYVAKGYCNALLKGLGVIDFYYDVFDPVPASTPLALWHGGKSASIKIKGGGEIIGHVGEINPLVLTNFDIHERTVIFDFDLEKLKKAVIEEREYEPIRKYPEIIRDISIISPGGVLVDEILQTIQRAGGDLVLDVDLFDIYDFDDGSSSYAFHIVFGASDRTLKSGEVDSLMKEIVSLLEKELKIKTRK